MKRWKITALLLCFLLLMSSVSVSYTHLDVYKRQGVGMGIVLHQFVIQTVEVDAMMFGRKIDWPSFVYSALLTLIFAVFVNFIMYYRLRKIDMIESLKSVE